METQHDVRENKPSMSGLARVLACPGSVRLSRGLSTKEKAWTRDGNKGHDVLSGEIDPEEIALREDLQWVTERGETLFEKLAGDVGFDSPKIVIGMKGGQPSERLWLHDDKGEPVISGEIDRAYIQDGIALLPDFKLGRAAVTEAALNYQVIGYATLLQEEYGIRGAYLQIIQPWRKPTAPAYIDADGLAAYRTVILNGLEAAEEPEAPRYVGPHCTYCPARSNCAEALALTSRVTTLSGGQPGPLAMRSRFALLSAAQKVELFQWKEHAKKTLKEMDEVFADEIDGPGIAGLQRGKGSTSLTIPLGVAYETFKNEMPIATAFELGGNVTLTAVASVLTGGSPTTKKLTKAGEDKKTKLREQFGEQVVVTVRKGGIQVAQAALA